MAKIIYATIAAVISLPVIFSYFSSGYFPTHDGEWAVIRLADMMRELRNFQFPVRWSSYLNHGYGYPLFNFTYPFPYYLGAAISFLTKIGLVDTIKLLFAVSIPISAVGMFILARKYWQSNIAGLIASVFYVYLPYRIVDLYVRGSLGESLSFAIFPFLLWAIISQKFKFTAVLFAILITTHNIMAVIFLPILLIFGWRKMWSALLLGLGMSAFFWLPALYEKQFILLSKIPIADRSLYFLSLPDLWTPKWGYGMPGTESGFGYQLGWPHLLVFLLAIITKRKFYYLIIGLYLFMLFPVSTFLWKLPLFSEINYPWTLLAPIGFLISLSAGVLFKKRFLGIVLCFCAILLVWSHLLPLERINKGDAYYQSNDATTTSSNELMPLWVNPWPTARPETQIQIYFPQTSARPIGNIISIACFFLFLFYRRSYGFTK